MNLSQNQSSTESPQITLHKSATINEHLKIKLHVNSHIQQIDLQKQFQSQGYAESRHSNNSNSPLLLNQQKSVQALSKIAQWKHQKKQNKILNKMLRDMQSYKRQEEQRKRKQEQEQKEIRRKQLRKIESLRNIKKLKDKQLEREENTPEFKHKLIDEQRKRYVEFLTTDISKPKSDSLASLKEKQQATKSNNPLKQLKKQMKDRKQRLSQFKSKLRQMKIHIDKEKEHESSLKIHKQLQPARYRYSSLKKADSKQIYYSNNLEELVLKYKKHSINYLQRQKNSQNEQDSKQNKYQNYIPYNRQHARKLTDIGYLIRNPSKQNMISLLEKGNQLEREAFNKLQFINQHTNYEQILKFQNDVDDIYVKAIKAKLATMLLTESPKPKLPS